MLKISKTNLLNLLMILSVMTAILGCRPMSNLLDPAKNTEQKQLKVVERGQPNLADETEEREVDPDSDELVEATEEELASEPVASDTSSNTPVPNNTNTAEPNADLAQIEQKAKSIVGRWQPADSEENVIFEFTPSKKEGDTFVGTFNFYASDGARDEPSKYIVSRDEMIKLIQFGKEHKIEVSVSADGNTMRFVNQDGEVSNLRRTNAQPNKQPEATETEVAPQKPKATPPKIEIPQ